ncbi:MAG: hypothetical protein ABSG62_19455 [Terracidiphilus sp.]
MSMPLERRWLHAKSPMRSPRQFNPLKSASRTFSDASAWCRSVDTRSQTPPSPPTSPEELTRIALSLVDRVGADPRQKFRLVGVGLGNFSDPGASTEPLLFP